jgi:hypothetical protein
MKGERRRGDQGGWGSPEMGGDSRSRRGWGQSNPPTPALPPIAHPTHIIALHPPPPPRLPPPDDHPSPLMRLSLCHTHQSRERSRPHERSRERSKERDLRRHRRRRQGRGERRRMRRRAGRGGGISLGQGGRSSREGMAKRQGGTGQDQLESRSRSRIRPLGCDLLRPRHPRLQ